MAKHGDPLSELLSRQGGVAPQALAPVPAAPAPTSELVPTSVTPAQPTPPAEEPLPDIPNEEDVQVVFQRIHGRPPTATDLVGIRAVPLLTRQLGREPTRAELLQFLEERRLTPPPVAPEFELDPGTSNPTGV